MTHDREQIIPLIEETERIVAMNLPDRRDQSATEFGVQACFGAACFRATAARLSQQDLDHDAEAEALTSLLLDGLWLRPSADGKKSSPGTLPELSGGLDHAIRAA